LTARFPYISLGYHQNKIYRIGQVIGDHFTEL